MTISSHFAVHAGLQWSLVKEQTCSIIAQAWDCREGIALAGSKQPDIAVLDCALPGIEPLQYCEALKATNRRMKIALIGYSLEAEAAQRAIASGATAFLDGQSSVETFRYAIQAALSGKTYIDPALAARMFCPQKSDQRLSPREREVLQLMMTGEPNKLIAARMNVSEQTVKTHVSNLMRKLEATSRTGAVITALQRSLIKLPPESATA